MKSVLIKFIMSIGLLTSLNSCKDETILPSSDLPTSITTFIQTHFPNQSILQSIKDYNETPFSFDYEILLSDFVVLEFTKNGTIKKIESKNPIPSLAIPNQKIVEKVNELFPNASIIEWEIDDRKQEVKLSNQISLEFNKNGEFLRIDD